MHREDAHHERNWRSGRYRREARHSAKRLTVGPHEDMGTQVHSRDGGRCPTSGQRAVLPGLVPALGRVRHEDEAGIHSDS
jgi:hypothetical protein